MTMIGSNIDEQWIVDQLHMANVDFVLVTLPGETIVAVANPGETQEAFAFRTDRDGDADGVLPVGEYCVYELVSVPAIKRQMMSITITTTNDDDGPKRAKHEGNMCALDCPFLATQEMDDQIEVACTRFSVLLNRAGCDMQTQDRHHIADACKIGGASR